MKDNEFFNEQVRTNKSFFEKVKDLKSLNININIKEGYENSKNAISKTSSNLKESVYKNVHKKTEETADRINDAFHKNSKLHNLEELLYLDKSHLVSSDKTNSFYKPMPKKIIIFENSQSGDVESITIKEDSKISTYVVKYNKYKPFIYPSFSDDKIPGEPFYMDEDEIWYRQDNTITVCYKKNNKMEFVKLDISQFKNLTEEDMIPFVKKYNFICRSPKLSRLVEENNIDIDNIIRATEKYIIEQYDDGTYAVYIYDPSHGIFYMSFLRKLPDINTSSLDAIFTVEMSQFILENNYPIEQFEEHDGYIEYNTNVAGRRVCVLRIKA